MASTSVTAPVTRSGWLAATTRFSAFTSAAVRPVRCSSGSRRRSSHSTTMSAPTTPRNSRRVDSSGIVNVSVYSVVHSASTYGPVTCRAPVSRGIANQGSWV